MFLIFPKGASTSGPTDTHEERTEETYQPKAVVVENIPEDMTRDHLGLIVESIAGVSEDDYLMEIIYESCVAVVTLINTDSRYFVLYIVTLTYHDACS